MEYKDFVFKGEWYAQLSQLPFDAYSVLSVVEHIITYGATGKEYEFKPCQMGDETIEVLREYKELYEKIKTDIDSQKVKPPKKEKVKIPPTLEEVIQYVKDNNLNVVDPYQFWNFYESKGWFVGKNKMKNWHCAIATWIKRNQVQYGTGQQSNIINKVADILAD